MNVVDFGQELASHSAFHPSVAVDKGKQHSPRRQKEAVHEILRLVDAGGCPVFVTIDTVGVLHSVN